MVDGMAELSLGRPAVALAGVVGPGIDVPAGVGRTVAGPGAEFRPMLGVLMDGVFIFVDFTRRNLMVAWF